MSEEDVELLVTMDDPGEDTLEEDHFHLQDKPTARWPNEVTTDFASKVEHA